MKNQISKKTKKQVMVDGLMAFGELENGLRTADFQAMEDVELEAFTSLFKVQGMRDGNLYMTEQPKRVRNKPMFREDNSSFSMGRNHQVYFVFTMSDALIDEVPQQLVRQASVIAQKIIRDLLSK